MLLGMEKPSSGRVLFRGRDLESMSQGQRAEMRSAVQPIFQDPFESLNPFYRVDHVFTIPVRKLGLAGSRAEEHQLIRAAIEDVGLRPDEILGRYPHELSGGQRQRLMVARAMLIRPRAILADEPVSMVDASLRATILESLRDLHQRLRVSLIYVTHDLTTAFQISDAVIILYRGRIVEAGSADEVIKVSPTPTHACLSNSIPRIDKIDRWDDKADLRTLYDASSRSCAFQDRCPSSMARCRAEIPPLFSLGVGRATRCFLDADRPQALADVLARELAGETVTGGTMRLLLITGGRHKFYETTPVVARSCVPPDIPRKSRVPRLSWRGSGSRLTTRSS